MHEIGYTQGVTAKEALMDLVEDLSEEDARDAFDILADIFQTPPERPTVSPEDMESVRRGLADLDAGRSVPRSEVVRRFGPERWR